MTKHPSSDESPVLGIDLGGTKILAAIVDPGGKIVRTAKKKTRAELGGEQILDRIVDVAKEVTQKADLSLDSLAGVGIGAPGQIDFETGTIVYAPNLGWKNVALVKHLREALGLPVALDNDVNAVAVAEHRWGAAKGIDDFIAISVGTGVGSGLFIGGKLHHGFNGTAGEIGHMIIDRDGPPWPASNRGCLEAMASRTAIAQRLEKAMAKGKKTILTEIAGTKASDIRSKVLRQALEAKDRLVTKEINRASRILGKMIGSVINLLGPEMIVLGGGVMEACGDHMLPIIDHVARETAISSSADHVKIVVSKLGDDAGILGAAALVGDG
jgi:glucokinase